MKINKKITLIALVCVVISAAAFFAFNNRPPAESGPPAILDSSQTPDASVNDITSPESGQESDPAASNSKTAPDVIDPEKENTDITVPLTNPEPRPSGADSGKHEKGDENEPPKPTETPPATTPEPAPAKSGEPQSGDTNEKGQVWVPGFGWVTPGGGNQVIPGDSDGDINKQVGDM